MKILLVVSTLSSGGAQRAFANMSIGFPKEWEFDFLLNDSQDITYSYRGKIFDLGFKPRKNKHSLYYQICVFVKRIIKLKKLKRTGGYAACISALTSANIANIVSGNQYCKTIVSVRNFMSRKLQSNRGLDAFLERYLTEFMYNRADQVVAVSESMKEDLNKNFGISKKKLVSIYNGYNLENIKLLSEEGLTKAEQEWFQPNKKILVTVGRLEKQKRHESLIRAFKKVREYDKNVILFVLGEGKLRNRLLQLVRDLDLEDSVVFCGFVKNPYKIVKRSHIFVLPSLFEGFPNTLAESLCLGIPVISTDCDSGAREILAPDTEISKKVTCGFEKAKYGLLCPVCENDDAERLDLTAEEQDMADAVLYLLRNPDVYEFYKKQCKERAEQLSIDKVIGDWIRLIEK